VTLGAAGIAANHIPLLLDPAAGEFGTLRGHVARANPVWRDLVAGVETVAIFQGAPGYISPNWYPGKAEHGKAVPTWNYCVVHAHGSLRVIDDVAWVRRMVDELTTRHEAEFAAPWSIGDAPADYIDNMLKAIVGIELPISRLLGKWKVSQNQPAENRAGVVRGLQELDTPEAAALATLVGREMASPRR
jgi:transcriptional regulator